MTPIPGPARPTPPRGAPSTDPASSGTHATAARSATALLILVTLPIIVYSFFFARQETSLRALDLSSSRADALARTKIAYQSRERFRGERLPHRTEARRRSEAVQAWTYITDSGSAAPSDWRRLGITRFFFGDGDGMTDFRHVADTPSVAIARARRRPQDHEPAPEMAPRAETALWSEIYGAGPLRPEQARALREQIRPLALGWFEHLVAEHLYMRAGLYREAGREDRAARAAVTPMVAVSLLQLLLIVLGGIADIGLLFWLLMSWAGSQSGRNTPPVRSDAASSPTAWPAAPLAPEPASGSEPHESPLLYRAAAPGFVAYLICFVFAGKLLSPFLPSIRDWSPEAVGRLALALNIVLSAAAAAIAVAMTAALSGKGISRSPLTHVRDTIYRMGLRSRSLLTDLAVGVGGYLLLLPVFVLSATLSGRLFRNIPTPINPVELYINSLTTPLDRLLVVLTTALAGPFVEELMFRGLLYRGLREHRSVPAAVLISASVFALMHPTMPGQFLPLATLGAGFAIACERRNSLVPAFVMHALNNLMVLLVSFAIAAR